MLLDVLEVLSWLLLLVASWYGIYKFFKAADKAFDSQKAEYEREWRHGW